MQVTAFGGDSCRQIDPLRAPAVKMTKFSSYLTLHSFCGRDVLLYKEQYRYLAKAICEMTVYKDDDSSYKPDLLVDWSYCYANGPLLDGAGLCQAYSQAYQWLCHRAGLACVLEHSSAQAHTWNLIQLENGDTYHMDLTWSDSYDAEWWFFLSQEDIEADHIPNADGFVATGK